MLHVHIGFSTARYVLTLVILSTRKLALVPILYDAILVNVSEIWALFKGLFNTRGVNGLPSELVDVLGVSDS